MFQKRLNNYLSAPVFGDDEDKTFAASLLHVILWSLLVGICLYTLLASLASFVQPNRLSIAWLYALALSGLTLVLMVVMRRGHVRLAANAINAGLWLVLTVAAYFSGGVIAPAYGGYVIVVICACLLVSWQAGLIAAVASALIGAVFFLAGDRLPEFTYSIGSVWSAAVAYFLVATLLLTLALRAIRRASQRTRAAMAERLKVEQALNQSEQRFHTIFNSVNDAIFVQDLIDGRILDVNQRMCEMYGYTLEEARQLRVEDLSAGVPPYTQAESLVWDQKAAGGEPQIFEWRAKDSAGRLFWVEVNMRRAALGDQDCLLVAVRDIDDRKQAEEVRRREQAYYEAIVNATPVMLWLKDTENRTLRINPAAARLEGAPPSQIEGKSSYDLYPREQAAAFYRDDLEVIHSGRDKLGIVEQHTTVGTGQVRWLETGKAPIRDDQGKIVGVLACSMDITARKEAEQVQAATRQIAEAALMTQNLDEFYRSVQAIILPLIPASNFYIALYDAATDLFHVPYLCDEFDQEWAPYHPGKGLNAYILRTGEPLLATPEVFAALHAQRQVEIIYRPMVDWLGVPLKTPQGLLGVMAVQNYSGPARLTDGHKELLMFVSAQVAMAIERKRAEERERSIGQRLRAVIEAAQELISCPDLDTLHRRSVELARAKLGLERCGLYVVDEREEFILGTFGTDDQGRTTDERRARHPFRDRPELPFLADRLWTTYERDFTFWEGDHYRALEGRGWNAATPIRRQHRTVGVLYNDSALTHALLDETQQDIVAVYCSLLGELLELKRTEAELSHERDLLQALMDNFPDTIYFKDAASRFTRINRAQARLLGVAAPEEAIGKTDADFFQNTELVQTYLREEQRLMTTGEPIINRVEYNPPLGGQPRWLSASKVPLRDAAGQIVGMVGISRDISDRMLAEQRQQTLSQGLRAVIGAAQDLIDCPDMDTLYRRSVELAREKLDVERCGLFLLDEAGMLHGTYGTDLARQTTDERAAHFPPVNPEQFETASAQLWTVNEAEQTYWDAAQQTVVGTGWIGTTFIRTRDRIVGVLYNDAAITHAPADEARQEMLAVYCSLLGSLIELKHAEAALRKSEARLRLLTDNMVDSISQMDKQWRFVYISPSMTRAFGYERHDLLQRPLMDYLHPDDAALLRRRLVMALELELPSISLEYRFRNAQGRAIWVESEARLLYDEYHEFAGAVFGSRDISARKQTEAEREGLIRELEAKNGELERFTYTVSHDLKSPLITIRGFLGFVEKDAASGNLDRLRADLQRIAEATTRMQRLLDELLELSRIGRLINPPQAVAFEAIAREALDLVHGRLAARGVQVELEAELPMVHGDRVRLVEVLQNLLDNAVKFMGDQPEPRIKIGMQESDRSAWPAFFVQDNGMGIDPVYQERAFGLFNKLDAQSEGTGVGLTLVKRIVEVHGGQVWVESAGLNTGSTFYFTLPTPPDPADDSMKMAAA